jgi:hypothetical protein
MNHREALARMEESNAEFKRLLGPERSDAPQNHPTEPKPKGVTMTVHVDMNPSLLKFAKAQTRRVRLLRGRLHETLELLKAAGYGDGATVRWGARALALTEKEPKLDG